MTDSAKELSTGTDITPATPESELSTLPTETLEPPMQELCLNMAPIEQLASGKVVHLPRNPHFSRRDVVNAFQTAFELVGGVPRLAIWADQNYDQYMKLYSRLLPSQTSSALGEANVLRIEMAILPSPLDEVEVPVEGEFHAVPE